MPPMMGDKHSNKADVAEGRAHTGAYPGWLPFPVWHGVMYFFAVVAVVCTVMWMTSHVSKVESSEGGASLWEYQGGHLPLCGMACLLDACGLLFGYGVVPSG